MVAIEQLSQRNNAQVDSCDSNKDMVRMVIGQFFPLRNELVPVEESPIQLG